jgi:hypothetical protein
MNKVSRLAFCLAIGFFTISFILNPTFLSGVAAVLFTIAFVSILMEDK